MAPKKPLIERMKENPQNDWTIEDVQRLCRDHGWSCHPPSNGSHWKVSHPDAGFTETIPARRPIKPYYIKMLVHFIELIEQAGEAVNE